MNVARTLPFTSTAALLAMAAVAACSQSLSTDANTAADGNVVEILHEPCDLTSKSAVQVDVNNDGRADITRVMDGNREVCRAADLNLDGKVDSFLYFDPSGKLRRRESDFDRDGVIDEIALYKNGQVVRKDRETNLDGKLDTWDSYVGNRLVKRERDTNADGRVDQWWEYPANGNPDCPIMATDNDSDGRPDSRVDICKERQKAESALTNQFGGTADAAPPPPPPTPTQDESADAPDGGHS